MTGDVAKALAEQLAYYRARAAEYDEWWYRRGRYDRGAELNASWFEEAREVERALERFRAEGNVLELACGTGIWSDKLLRHARALTAVDASPEMLNIHRAKLRSERVRYVQADLFEWIPDEHFDAVFFGFWLSHVPPPRFEAFWRWVRAALAPDGRVFFVDSRKELTASAKDHVPPANDVSIRRLNDGRTFKIYKIFYEVDELTERLGKLRWDADVRTTSRYFVYGSCWPRQPEAR